MSDTSTLKSFFAGAIGGVCVVLVGHPLDTIKVRLQLQTKSSNHYNGVSDAILKTFNQEGFRGFYKGMLAPLIGVTPLIAISFASYNFGKDIQRSFPNQTLNLAQIYIAGMISGFFCTAVIVPIDRIKCSLQNQSNFVKKVYNGPFDCCKQIIQTEGLRGLYKGTTLTILRDVPGTGTYFCVYEAIMRNWLGSEQKRENKSMGKILVAGGVAGSIYWFSSIVPDSLKTKQQTAPYGTYKNLKHLFIHTVQNGGIRSLFQGLTPVMIRSFPANAACFVGYEYAVKFFDYFFVPKT